MTAPPLKEIMVVDPAVQKALGKTPDQLADMTLKEFFELAYYNGFDVRAAMGGGAVKGLTVRMDDEDRPILHVG